MCFLSENKILKRIKHPQKAADVFSTENCMETHSKDMRKIKCFRHLLFLKDFKVIFLNKLLKILEILRKDRKICSVKCKIQPNAIKWSCADKSLS